MKDLAFSKIIEREEWLPFEELTVTLPVANSVILHHTGSWFRTSDVYSDARILLDFVEGWNYLVHGSGIVIENVGWDFLTDKTVNIFVSGNYTHEDSVPLTVLEAITNIIFLGLRKKRLLDEGQYPTGGHRDIEANTICPGHTLYQKIGEIRTVVDAHRLDVESVDWLTKSKLDRSISRERIKVVANLPTLSKIDRAQNPGHTRVLQFMLREKAEQPIRIDGDFYRSTEAAVKNFQTTMGMTATGEVDDRTWKLLLELP